MTEIWQSNFQTLLGNFLVAIKKKFDHLMDDSLTPIIDIMTKFFIFHPKRIDCCPKTFVTI
jgi:hypothetical protein